MVSHKRTILGYVYKFSGCKSVGVVVERRVIHPKYRKIVKKFSKYIVHDPESMCNMGDVIEAIECKPISKLKSFKVSKIIARGVSK